MKYVTATFAMQLHNGQFRAASCPACATAEEIETVLLSGMNSYTSAVLATALRSVTAQSYNSVVLACGWAERNYLYIDGAWYLCHSLNPSDRVLLVPGTVADTPATEKQLTLVERVTRSHVFDNDRMIIRHSASNATEVECSQLIDWLLREVKSRKELEKSWQQAA